MIIFVNLTRVVTKISSCRVFVVSSRGSRKQSWSPSPPLPQEVFEVQLLPFSKRHYRPKKAISIMSTAIIRGFTMITSLLRNENIHVSTGPDKNDRLAPVTLSAQSYLHADQAHAGQ